MRTDNTRSGKTESFTAVEYVLGVLDVKWGKWIHAYLKTDACAGSDLREKSYNSAQMNRLAGPITHTCRSDPSPESQNCRRRPLHERLPGILSDQRQPGSGCRPAWRR